MTTAKVPRVSRATEPAPTTQATPPAPGLTPCTLLETLFDAAHSNLSTRELEEIASQSGEMAKAIALRAADVAEGVAEMVASGDIPGSSRVFLNNSDLPGLLVHFGDVFRHVAGLVSVGDEASSLVKRGGR